MIVEVHVDDRLLKRALRERFNKLVTREEVLRSLLKEEFGHDPISITGVPPQAIFDIPATEIEEFKRKVGFRLNTIRRA